MAAYVSLAVQSDQIAIAELSGSLLTTHSVPLQGEDFAEASIHWLRGRARRQHLSYVAASFPAAELSDDLLSRLWLQDDVVPYRYHTDQLEPSPGLTRTPRIAEGVKAVSSHFDANHIAETKLGPANEVLVTELVSLEEYRQITSARDFMRLTTLAQRFQGRRLVFLSATPQGGGVALMRHALIRLLRLVDVDAHWHVLMPRKEAFDITKTKFHNVLQAVANREVELTAEEKLRYALWMRENAQLLQPVFRDADVIVIDDPQPSGLIPFIKQVNPSAKIIYRSHIQIMADLTNQVGTPQYATWSYLWENIQLADCFVSHPIDRFIPAIVPAKKVFYLPATTDPLDGLNKPLTDEQTDNYLRIFNRIASEQQQTPLDVERPYIIQIARFDPSKGIPDVLESYLKLRQMLAKRRIPEPQLVITGNGSIDDPDGKRVHAQTLQIVEQEPYKSFAQDIKIVRLPHRDQILNALLRRSAVALQLSIREGFEIKVTEALLKGIPVIAYNVGGLPLQIENGVSGHLVPVGNTTRVAEHLYELFSNPAYYQRMSQAAYKRANPAYLTIPNAISWLSLAQTESPSFG
ncbi:glycosyl transferase family 1 [Tengunoibacter tsumagoiensis]|uniref:Glycosyl transferase family 1 n=2 Tax=Tengunoibacter tsumagoiensis TaxID=2014871 RepID=A0A402A1G8_9CHLR|nr:glycosyl transferase family 1 [Tengunoibacter tsumagoiensis]